MAARKSEGITPPRLAVREADGGAVLEASGDWLIETIGTMDANLRALGGGTGRTR